MAQLHNQASWKIDIVFRREFRSNGILNAILNQVYTKQPEHLSSMKPSILARIKNKMLCELAVYLVVLKSQMSTTLFTYFQTLPRLYYGCTNEKQGVNFCLRYLLINLKA